MHLPLRINSYRKGPRRLFHCFRLLVNSWSKQ